MGNYLCRLVVIYLLIANRKYINERINGSVMLAVRQKRAPRY